MNEAKRSRRLLKGYHPLIVSLANTAEPLFLVNRGGNRPSTAWSWSARRSAPRSTAWRRRSPTGCDRGPHRSGSIATPPGSRSRVSPRARKEARYAHGELIGSDGYRLQEAVFAGEVRTVVVWKLDRLSRRQRDGVDLLADWCERGVRVVAVTQQIDLSGAVGRMVASVLFGLAEIESEYHRERQAAGIAVAKERGAYRGRRRGTTKAPPRRARELRGRGLSVKEIATALGISRRTALRYLAAAPAP